MKKRDPEKAREYQREYKQRQRLGITNIEETAYQEIVGKSLTSILEMANLPELPERSHCYTIALKRKKT